MAFIIQDNVLTPRHELIMEYGGPNPIQIYPQIDTMMRLIFESKGTHMYEPDFRWDTTEDPRPFFIKIYTQRPLDNYTKFQVSVLLWGKQYADKTKGSTTKIVISGRLTTSFPTDNIFQKIFMTPFFYLYSIAYYNDIRRSYIKWVRDGIYKLESQIRDRLNMPQSETSVSEEVVQETQL